MPIRCESQLELVCCMVIDSRASDPRQTRDWTEDGELYKQPLGPAALAFSRERGLRLLDEGLVGHYKRWNFVRLLGQGNEGMAGLWE